MSPDHAIRQIGSHWRLEDTHLFQLYLLIDLGIEKAQTLPDEDGTMPIGISSTSLAQTQS